jgi:hypothetical protein
MPAFTLAQAIAATGRSRSTLIRAIRRGKLSAARDESGTYLVEPSELHRVFPVISAGTPDDPSDGVPRHADLAARLDAERAKNAILQDVIADLRQQRDRESEERRRLTAVLADLRQVPARRAWWRWCG